MRTDRAIPAICACVLLATIAACGGDDTSAPPDDGGTFNGTIRVLDNRFSPASVTVAVGDSVTWNWEGSNFHTVTQGTDPTTPPPASKLFDSGLQNSGSFGYKFTNAGTVNYYCDPHRTMGMTGTVTVNP